MILSKFDIGAEILSILTKGMYPDPRDAVREYIQNAVDAKAKNVEVKVRQNSVVVEDDGVGMNYVTLRKALRLGISDKQPGKDVGFMGIGIYSAFHLCDTLTIYSRKANTLPLKLEMNFQGMRNVLEEQKVARLKKKIKSDELIDLQTLLQTFIALSAKGTLSKNEYPVKHGTRVELVSLNPILDDLLNDFDKLSQYLRDVVPLHFDKERFKWAGEIEQKIVQSCNRNRARFEMINLTLQVGSNSQLLYRRYQDSDFANNAPQEPKFVEIKKDEKLIGIAWGCLNSARAKIKDKEFRGFLLKKQGFSIGKREDLARFFGASDTHFDRYIGEIIIIVPEILPNAARNGLEFSSLSTFFETQIADLVAPFYNRLSSTFQENSRAQEIIENYGNQLKTILSVFSPNEDNPTTLIDVIAELSEIKRILKGQKGKATGKNKSKLEGLLKETERLERAVKLRLTKLTEGRTKTANGKKDSASATKIKVAEGLADYSARKVSTKFENILELTEFLEIDYSDEMKTFLLLIDEKFVQALAKTKADYYRLLDELKGSFSNEESF
jgi:Histidine kinase-, DNA gyrase B-, and HSP90-like ATPase